MQVNQEHIKSIIHKELSTSGMQSIKIHQVWSTPSTQSSPSIKITQNIHPLDHVHQLDHIHCTPIRPIFYQVKVVQEKLEKIRKRNCSHSSNDSQWVGCCERKIHWWKVPRSWHPNGPGWSVNEDVKLYHYKRYQICQRRCQMMSLNNHQPIYRINARWLPWWPTATQQQQWPRWR